MGIASLVRPQQPAASLVDAFKAIVHGNPLQPGRVFVGIFELDDWWPWLDEAATLVDAAELARARSRRNPVDRDRLLLCYALHRLLLARFLQCDAAWVPLGRDAAGCPRLAEGHLQTSLSHADGAMAAAVAMCDPVGVDLEPAARAPVMPGIVDRLCHPDELPALSMLAPASRERALLRLWVRKEACLKAAGTGLLQEMTTFPAAGHGVLSLPDGSPIRVRMLEAGSAWVAACAARPGAEIQAGWLRPRGEPAAGGPA